MRWIKVIAIGAAVIVALAVVSAVMHLIYLAVVAIAIGAVVVLALKAWQALRGGARRISPRDRQTEAPSPRMAPPQIDTRATPPPPAADVEAELARLKREME